MTARVPPAHKPLLRGVSHQIAAVVALIAGVALIASTPSRRGQLAAAIYAASVTLLFGISALYHRPHWSPPARLRMRRLDHSAIFVLIAGTYTPFCLLLPPPSARTMLGVIWTGAALGVVQSILWVKAPKALVAAIYVTLGWAVLPFWSAMSRVVSPRQVLLLVIGGVAYSVGALIYALRRPDPLPSLFGYHELFHALTIVAAACHFVAVMDAVRQLGGT